MAALNRYVAVLFSDLERHSLGWSSVPRDAMVATIAEYRYVAESLAGKYGSLYREWAGDGHMFLFESADTAVRFGLRLLADWRQRREAVVARAGVPPLALRLGCHFGECTRMEGGAGWVGRANAVAKRAESEAEPDSLFVTASVLDLLDLPLYSFEEAGSFTLKGDHLSARVLYRMIDFDEAALATRPRQELTAEDWFLKAVGFIGTPLENSAEEEECYRAALALRPDYAEAHNNLAVLLRRRGESAEASKHYQEALRLRPDYPEAHANFAALLLDKGSAGGAVEHYRQALRLRPDYVDAHHGYANLLAGRRELADAVTHYQEALSLRPDSPEAHSNLAIVLEDLGRRQEAAFHYREALRIRGDYAEAHYNYALLLESEGEPGAAEEHYREAVRIWPEYGEAHNNLAILLQARGELDQAEEHYRAALGLRPDDPEAHYNYALLLRAKGDGEEADHHFRTAYELAPDVPAFRSAIEPPR